MITRGGIVVEDVEAIGEHSRNLVWSKGLSELGCISSELGCISMKLDNWLIFIFFRNILYAKIIAAGTQL